MRASALDSHRVLALLLVAVALAAGGCRSPSASIGDSPRAGRAERSRDVAGTEPSPLHVFRVISGHMIESMRPAAGAGQTAVHLNVPDVPKTDAVYEVAITGADGRRTERLIIPFFRLVDPVSVVHGREDPGYALPLSVAVYLVEGARWNDAPPDGDLSSWRDLSRVLVGEFHVANDSWVPQRSLGAGVQEPGVWQEAGIGHMAAEAVRATVFNDKPERGMDRYLQDPARPMFLRVGGADAAIAKDDLYLYWLAAGVLRDASYGLLFCMRDGRPAMRMDWVYADGRALYVGEMQDPATGEVIRWVLWPLYGEWITPGDDDEDPRVQYTRVPAGVAAGSVVRLSVYVAPLDFTEDPFDIDADALVRSGEARLALRFPVPVIVQERATTPAP